VGRIEYRDYSVLVAIKAGHIFACGVGPLVSQQIPALRAEVLVRCLCGQCPGPVPQESPLFV
jgi:hypothetical protein